MTLPSASISFLDADSKAILNGINLRLNDIDLKLSIVLELLATRLPAQLPTTSSPTENGTLFNSLSTTFGSTNLLHTLANASANLVSPSHTKFTDSLTARLLAACQDHVEITPGSKNVPSLLKTESTESMIWHSPSERPSPTVADLNGTFSVSMMAQASPTISTAVQNENVDGSKSCGGSAESKEFTDDGEYGDDDDEIKDEYEDVYHDSNANTPVTLIKQGMGLASPGVDEASTSTGGAVANVEGRFPEGAVKRAAEKAARSFQSTQPKV